MPLERSLWPSRWFPRRVNALMHPTLQVLLNERPVVVTDGAWGTQLQSLGLGLHEFPDLWNVTHPERVTDVARGYVEAGSAVVLTNTFGANRIRLQHYGLAAEFESINRAGVELSLRAADKRCLVFASIGPSGKMLLTGDVSLTELRNAFREQAQVLADAGAQGLVVETMSDLSEAQAAVMAAAETKLPVIGCMVFGSGKTGDRTMMGNTPEQVAEVLDVAGADVIGANCGHGISGFVPLCERLRAATQKPIWIKANAGLPVVDDDKVTYPVSPQEFASFIPALVNAGANFIGGCCGTSPSFIRAVACSVQTAPATHDFSKTAGKHIQ